MFNDDDDQYNATNSGNISLDEFMRTDSFEAPLADIDEDDSDDMTLMPDEVPPGANSTAPVIDDVFDITGDQVIEPEPEPEPKDGDDDEDDDSESPTEFQR